MTLLEICVGFCYGNLRTFLLDSYWKLTRPTQDWCSELHGQVWQESWAPQLWQDLPCCALCTWWTPSDLHWASACLENTLMLGLCAFSHSKEALRSASIAKNTAFVYLGGEGQQQSSPCPTFWKPVSHVSSINPAMVFPPCSDATRPPPHVCGISQDSSAF